MKTVKYVIGTDIGGTSIKFGLFSPVGELLGEWSVPTNVEENGRHILSDAAASIRAELDKRGIAKEQIIGVGVGVPGPVDENGVVFGAVNLHWGRTDVVGELRALLDMPIMAGNDANVAALGEAWKGGAEGFANVIMLTLGTGVGGGIIIGNKIIAGTNGAAGELGHAHLVDDWDVPCNCGNTGCLEQVASATGIATLARKRLAKDATPSILRANEKNTAKHVFDAYKDNDAVAIEIVEQFADYLGKAMAIFAVVTDPQVFLLGGGVSNAGQVLVDVVTNHFRKYAMSACQQTQVRLATLGNRAGIYGAARLVMGE